MLDLKPYCYTGESRPYLHRPFSRGDYTYATNGHIIVRVPRREDVEEPTDMPIKDPDVVFTKVVHRDSFKPLPAWTLPKLTEDECDSCNGSGAAEHCCSCECQCNDCEGKGFISSDAGKSVEYRGVHFALKYIRMICSFPNVQVTDPTASEPMGFRFDGGEGALMAMRYACGESVGVFAGADVQQADGSAQAQE